MTISPAQPGPLGREGETAPPCQVHGGSCVVNCFAFLDLLMAAESRLQTALAQMEIDNARRENVRRECIRIDRFTTFLEEEYGLDSCYGSENELGSSDDEDSLTWEDLDNLAQDSTWDDDDDDDDDSTFGEDF